MSKQALLILIDYVYRARNVLQKYEDENSELYIEVKAEVDATEKRVINELKKVL